MALDYENCNSSSDIQDLIHTNVYYRWATLLQQFNALDACRNLRTPVFKPAQPPIMVFAKHCCHSLHLGGTASKYNTCDVCVHYHSKDPFYKQQCSFLPSILSWIKFPYSTRVRESDIFRACQEVKPTYNPQEFVSLCCGNYGQTQSSRPSVQMQGSRRVSNDKFVRESVKNRSQKKCRKLKFRRWYHWGTTVNIDNLDLHNESYGDFTGLGCRTNKTVNFYAMDSRQSYMFAQKLGIDEHMSHNFTGVVLFDKRVSRN